MPDLVSTLSTHPQASPRSLLNEINASFRATCGMYRQISGSLFADIQILCVVPFYFWLANGILSKSLSPSPFLPLSVTTAIFPPLRLLLKEEVEKAAAAEEGGGALAFAASL